MNMIINDEVCRDLKIPIEQCMYLLLLYQKKDDKSVESIVLDTIRNNWVNCKDFKNGVPVDPKLTEEGIDIIERVLLNSEFKEGRKPLDRYDILADELRALYPPGKKPGTNYLWKDSRSIIAKRLKTLVKKYDFEFTNEEAVTATKKYIESFNGDFRYMQLLKYFISKQVIIDGAVEESSQLMSYIENSNELQEDNNWNIELK